MKSIDGKKVKELIEKNHAAAIDVAPQSNYKKEHIKGAINIPHSEKSFLSTVENKFKKKNEDIVLCGQREQSSQMERLGTELEHAGYKNVYQYQASPTEWKKSGLNVQSTSPRS